MTATTSIRSATKTRLRQLLGEEYDLDRVTIGAPAELPREGFLIGSVEGSSGIALQKAGRQFRDDRYTVTVWVYVRRPGRDADECEPRAEELVAHLEDVLAEKPRLEDGTGNGLPGLVSARLGDWKGPNSEPFDTEGWHAWCELSVDCHARLT